MKFRSKIMITLMVIVMLFFSFTIASVGALAMDNDKDNDDKGKLEKIELKLFAKPDNPGNSNKPKPGDDSGSYALIARGLKWKTLPVTYEINPTHPEGGASMDVTAVTTGAETWDGATGAELANDNVNTGSTRVAGTRDNFNVISFGDYPQDGVIGVCSIWGIFSGRPGSREIFEFDILLDIDFTWGNAGVTSENQLGDTSVMDIQNIITHEFGHGWGLDDLYESDTTEETMHGYASYGETKKRTLNTGDIAGIQELYSA